MSQPGGEIPFVGQAYEAPDLLQDAQRLINWYCEISGDKNSKMPIALLGSPGLSPIATLASGPVRGSWVLPSGQQCIFVVSNLVYVMSIVVPATSTTVAQFSTTQVGTLLTNAGRVVIRDNGVSFGGAGGYVVMVDGAYGYYYAISGAVTTVKFTGNLTLGSPNITFTATVPNGLLISPGVVITDSNGGLTSTSIVSIDFNLATVTLGSNATSNQTNDVFTVLIPAFGQITDPAFLPASRVAFIEGWLIFSQPGTRTVFTNAPFPYSLTFAGLFYALKDSSTDNLITLFENNRELWLCGERTSEVWYNAGGATFPFSRLPGIGPQLGCAALHSIARAGPNLVWLARNEQGEHFVVETNNYSYERISTHAIENAITSYPLTSDALGDVYEDSGHFFYVLSFPTADVTWIFDMTTRMWHQRLSFDPVAGKYHRHKGNCYVNFADLTICGDYQNGKIYNQSRSIYVDDTLPLRCQRRTPHTWSPQNRQRIFHGSIQVEFTPGVGLSVGQGSDPQAMLRWSDDGGFSWSNEHWTTIGKIGVTRNRALWRRLGRARDRVYELNYTDPTPRDIVGATLFGEGEEEAA